MVCHPAIGVNPASIPTDTIGQQPHPETAVSIDEENGLAAVAPKNGMVDAAWYMNSWLAGHFRDTC